VFQLLSTWTKVFRWL